MAAPPAAGKSTAIAILCARLEQSGRTVVHLHRRHRDPRYRQLARCGLLLRHPCRWLRLFVILRQRLGSRSATTRVAKYLTRVWQRREEIRLGRADVVIEDEGFVNWAARDLAYLPAFGDWFAANVDWLYPGGPPGRAVAYRILRLPGGELVRVQRLLRRRLASGSPARAGRKTRQNGLRDETLASEAAVLAIVLARPGIDRADPAAPARPAR